FSYNYKFIWFFLIVRLLTIKDTVGEILVNIASSKGTKSRLSAKPLTFLNLYASTHLNIACKVKAC
ncbi:MAG: hypothetical protein PUP92_34950, partial [Rhizonema sp. PD38]|nr:hypothetical protein [Rhizonema sp. PD38]